MTQNQMAELLNVSQNTYSQYETGKIEWTASTLIKIADYFDVSVDYLLDRTKSKNNEYRILLEKQYKGEKL